MIHEMFSSYLLALLHIKVFPLHTFSNRTMKPLILSRRDERVMEWLINQVGQEAVDRACTQLAGMRKPYPSNLAKLLGLTVPEGLASTPKDEARERIEQLRAILGRP